MRVHTGSLGRKLRITMMAIFALLITAACTSQADAPNASADPTNSTGDAVASLWAITSAAGEITGIGSDTGTEDLTLTMSGLRENVTQFSDRPLRQAATIPTQQLVANWPELFSNSQPNAALSFVADADPNPRVIVLQLGQPTYDAAAASISFPAKHLHRERGAEGTSPTPGTPAGVSAPASFSSGSLFIDSADTSASTTAQDSAGGSKLYGMSVGNWQKYRTDDYSSFAPPYGYFAQYFQTIAPYTEWVSNYGLLWPTDVAWVQSAKTAGLKVAATPQVVWNSAGPLPDNKNDTQIANAISLVNSGDAAAVVVGNEVTANVGGYAWDKWADDMVTYINTIKTQTGGKVPVGTSYPMAVFVADPTENAAIQKVNQACDFLQITVHPANYAAGIPAGTDPNTVMNPTEGLALLQKTYDASRSYMNANGLQSKELQIRETGWPSHSDFGNPSIDAKFTPANASEYLKLAYNWAHGNGIKLYWFEAVDEPQKAPATNDQYDVKNFEASWGIWHFTPANPNDAFSGAGPWGTFTQKYPLPWQSR